MVESASATTNDLVRWFAAVVCAASAGIHLALVPEHLQESVPLGIAFVASAVAMAACALMLRTPGHGRAAGAATAVVLLGTAVSYVLSRTSGLPVLIPEPEAPDLLGVVTTSAEGLAAAAAVWLLLDREEIR